MTISNISNDIHVGIVDSMGSLRGFRQITPLKHIHDSHMEVIDYFIKNNNKPTYAKKIYENVELSEPWVGKICKELVDIGIFKTKMKKIKDRRRPGKDTHYFISGGFFVYSILLKKYFSNPDWNKRLLFMDSSYAQSEFDINSNFGILIFTFWRYMEVEHPELVPWRKKTHPDYKKNLEILCIEQEDLYRDILKVSPSGFYYFSSHNICGVSPNKHSEENINNNKSFKDIIHKVAIKDDIIINPNQSKALQSFHRYLFKLFTSCMFSDILRYPEILNNPNRKRIVNRLLKEINDGQISKERRTKLNKIKRDSVDLVRMLQYIE